MKCPFYRVLIAVSTATVSKQWDFADQETLHTSFGFLADRVLSFVHEQTMFGGARTLGVISPSNATLILNNADGALDEFLNYPLDGQPVAVTYYNTDIPLNPQSLPSSVVFRGLIGGVNVSKENVTLDLLEYSTPILSLSAVPARYLGNNALPLGIEGTANDIKGRNKPRIVGAVFNITPKFVNTSKLIYQVEGQDYLRTGWSLVAYDGRTALTQGADYIDQTDMETNAPAAGSYRVAPYEGCFRLGSAPIFKVTCDVVNPTGGANSTPVATVVNNQEVHSVLSLMLQTAQVASPYTAFSGYFFGEDLAAYPKVGIYIDAERPWLDVINEVAASCGIALPFRLDNPMYVFGAQLKAPGTYLPTVVPYFRPWVGTTLTIDEFNVIDIDRVPAADSMRGVPVWRVNVNYKRNYTVMQRSEVGAITAADLAFVTQEWRTASAADATVKSEWLNSQELTINSLLVDESAAAAEAARLLALLKVRRDVFRVTIPMGVAFVPGQYGEYQLNVLPAQYAVLTYSRFGLSAGKGLIVLTSTPDHEKKTITMLLWG
jgi:hypothetical protein